MEHLTRQDFTGAAELLVEVDPRSQDGNIYRSLPALVRQSDWSEFLQLLEKGFDLNIHQHEESDITLSTEAIMSPSKK